MISKLVVCDVGPLIILARIEKLSLLIHLFDVVFITSIVQKECVVDISLPGAKGIDHAIHEKILHVLNPGQNFNIEKKLLSLDDGEKSAILLAKELHATLLIDEKRGRSVAQHLDVQILGTAGLLLRAYQRGLITDLHICLEDMKNQGYRLSERLIKAILKHESLLRSEKKSLEKERETK